MEIVLNVLTFALMKIIRMNVNIMKVKVRSDAVEEKAVKNYKKVCPIPNC